MKEVVIIRGFAGAGKTTVAKKLAERISGEYFSIDERIDAMDIQGEEEGGIPRKYFLAVQEDIIPNAQRALAQDMPVVFDGNFYWQEQFTQLKERLPFPQWIFTLTAPFAVCAERDKTRIHEKPRGEDVIRALITLTSRLSIGEEINTEGKSTDDVVEDIVQRLSV